MRRPPSQFPPHSRRRRVGGFDCPVPGLFKCMALALLAGGVLALLSLAPAGHEAFAQAAPDREKQNLEEKVAEMEGKITVLEGEVALLRERLEALLGSDSGVRVYNIPVGDSIPRGNPFAPVTLVVFGDYQSDYTARAQHVIQQLLDAYPDQLQVLFKHYPLTELHPLANEAALAALAAERQGRFWEFHDLLFLNYRRLDAPLLLVLAEEVGIDLSRFNQDRRSLWALERLAADEKLATSLGVKGLPTLFLNGRLMPTWRFDYLDAQMKKLTR